MVAITNNLEGWINPALKPPVSFPVSQLQDFPVDKRKTLFVVSNSISSVDAVMRNVAANLSTTYQLFNTEDGALKAYLMNSSEVSAGIIFGYQSKGNIFSYAIRMPGDQIASTQDRFTIDTGFCRNENPNGTSTAAECQANTYLQTGFAYLQYVIDQALLQQLNVTAPVQVTIQMMPKEKFTPPLGNVKFISAGVIEAAYSLYMNFLMVSLVAEKEKRIKDGMLMMGLRSSILTLSWILVSFAQILVVTSFAAIILRSTFENSNLFIVWLILVLYGFSVIAFAIFLTPFFKKARTAGIAAPILNAVSSLLSMTVFLTRTETADDYIDTISPAVRWVMCLISPIAFFMAMDTGFFLDKRRGGITFDKMTLGDFPLFAPVVMLGVDIVLYYMLSVYLEHVIPGEYGPRYKPWYFLEKSYWFPRQRDGEEAMQLDGMPSDDMSGPNLEPVSADMRSKCHLRVRDISKVFPGKNTTFAVLDLTLDIYEGQITALLGHNGAGKTTLLNMLTGVIPPTSGTAYIYGLDVSLGGNAEELRSICGICPQHNTLYDELSAREHLIIFAGIKGVASDQVESEVTKILKSVDLYDQKDVFAGKLSGGQQRKLSVAMALIGDPKVFDSHGIAVQRSVVIIPIVFLDEPTAGMDPFSRRHLWSLLRNSKEGRLIVLTTHFMDEADILADRKIIIGNGRLICCGSSLFLLNKFGSGYHLNMVVEPNVSLGAIISLLNQHVIGAKYQRSHGMELSFTIPISEVAKFASLFLALDAKKGSGTTAKSLGILSYGVSMPTLEEVFLNLGAEKETTVYDPMFSQLISSIGRVDDNRHEDQINRRDPSIALPQTVVESQHSAAVFRALLKLRFLLAVRNKLFFICSILGSVMMAYIIKDLQMNEIIRPNLRQAVIPLFTQLYSKFLVLDSVGNNISDFLVEYLNDTYKVDSYRGGTVDLSDVRPHDLGVNLLTTSQSWQDQLNCALVNVSFVTLCSMTVIFHTFNFSKASNLANYTALYNDSAYHSLPAIINTMSIAVLRTAGNITQHNISTFSLPWPTNSISNFNKYDVLTSVLIGYAFATYAADFCTIIVQEKQWKCKSQLRVAGVSFHMYWGTMFLFNIFVFLIPTSICLILILVMNVPSLTPTGATIMLALLFIVVILGDLLMLFLNSFSINKFEDVYMYLMPVFPLFGGILYSIVSYLDLSISEARATAVHYVFVFINPVYITFSGVHYMLKLYYVSHSQLTPMDPKISDYFKFSNNIIICLIAGLAYVMRTYFLLRFYEMRSMGRSVFDALRFCCTNPIDVVNATNTDIIQDEDEDVKQERQRVDNIECRTDGGQNVVAFVKHITKHYTKGKGELKVAVRDLSFAVNKGEVFGLLGPNGAGKTTALSIMTAEVTPTYGEVVVAGQHVQTSLSPSFVPLGFCPQQDPLWEPLTLKEHLELYAAIKGVPKAEVSRVINYFVYNLKLQEHQNKKVKELSGGTKRKLSYAISMLGNPKFVLLDEPSTGLDPQSKRFLWDVISSNFVGQDRGAILTTHYMEEADALCTRVAIMVNGQMECLGPTQHLKNKYGGGYLLELKLSGSSTATREELEARVTELEKDLVTLFPGATCLESFAERARYEIPQTDVEVLSSTFASLEETKRTHGVEQYSFSQSTLEQVFLNLAKKQIEEGEDEETTKIKRSALRKLFQVQSSTL